MYSAKMTIRYLLIPFTFFGLFTACGNAPDYDSMVRAALQSDVQSDSLFLGYRLGMTTEEFHDYSWELNQQGKITGLTQVEYSFNQLPGKATMRFYPEFHNNRIYKMPVTINYDAWAPWNHEFSSDSLVTDLVDLYRDIYDVEFRKVFVPELDMEAYFAASDNRGITIYRKSDMEAAIEFIDLKAKQEM